MDTDVQCTSVVGSQTEAQHYRWEDFRPQSQRRVITLVVIPPSALGAAAWASSQQRLDANAAAQKVTGNCGTSNRRSRTGRFFIPSMVACRVWSSQARRANNRSDAVGDGHGDGPTDHVAHRRPQWWGLS
jgi:hypothetical protein